MHNFAEYEIERIIFSQNNHRVEELAEQYLTDEVESVDDALQGARDIIAEWINERTDVRNNIRRQLERIAMISTKVIKVKIDA